MLLESPVLAEHVAVVAGVDDECICGLSRPFQRVQDPPHIPVEELDGRVIGGGDTLFLGRLEFAEDPRDLPVVFLPDRWNQELAELMPTAVFDRKMKRRMRLV